MLPESLHNLRLFDYYTHYFQKRNIIKLLTTHSGTHKTDEDESRPRSSATTHKSFRQVLTNYQTKPNQYPMISLWVSHATSRASLYWSRTNFKPESLCSINAKRHSFTTAAAGTGSTYPTIHDREPYHLNFVFLNITQKKPTKTADQRGLQCH